MNTGPAGAFPHPQYQALVFGNSLRPCIVILKASKINTSLLAVAGGWKGDKVSIFSFMEGAFHRCQESCENMVGYFLNRQAQLESSRNGKLELAEVQETPWRGLRFGYRFCFFFYVVRGCLVV